MKKIAGFIVSKRWWLAGAIIAAAIACAVAFSFVSINSDLTKYLPDSSSMKQGMDIMEEEFDDTEETYTIRVMSEGLASDEQASLIKALESIEYVDGVEHDESDDYNSGEYSLYVLKTSYDYGTAEETAIEESLENDFSEYNIVYRNDDTNDPNLPLKVVLAAMAILVIILLIMAQSWFEPVLFLAVAGIAVLINSGTNIFLGEISSITSQIAYILQLVLSMDYSIMLLNRYRENRGLYPTNKETMIKALSESFASITSSSLTTVVGLLALCFMEFKIGMDIGIVLAKGVFISMLSALLLMPCLILLFDKLIAGSPKPYLKVPMKWASTFSYKIRHLLIAAFLVLFAAFFILQERTEIVFTLKEDDPIEEVFASDNTTVLIYNNIDEDKIDGLISSLEEDENIRSVSAYANTLGSEHTADDMRKTLSDMSDDLDMDPVLFDLIYYMYFDGSTSPMSMSEFLTFLSEDVINNEAFSRYMGDDLAKQSEELLKFSDADELTQVKSVSELADFLEIDSDTARDLLLYYYTLYGGMSGGTMNIPTFVSFLIDEVAADETYGEMIDSSSLDSLNELRPYTDTSYITTKRSSSGMADILGMDSSSAKMLYVYYYYMSDSYSPGEMTLPEAVSLMRSSAFSSYMDSDTLSQINSLAPFTDSSAVTRQLDAASLASYLDMDESSVSLIFALYGARDVSESTMTLTEFLSYINALMSGEAPGASLVSGYFGEEEASQIQTLNTIVEMAVSGQAYGASELSAVTGIDGELILQMFAYQSMTTGQSVTAMTLPDFLDTASALLPMLAGSAGGTDYGTDYGTGDVTDYGSYYGADYSTDYSTDYGSYYGADYSTDYSNGYGTSEAADGGSDDDSEDAEGGSAGEGSGDGSSDSSNDSSANGENAGGSGSAGTDTYDTADAAAQLEELRQIVNLAVSETPLDASSMASVFGMDSSSAVLLYRLYFGSLSGVETMSVYELASFIQEDETVSGMLGSANLAQIGTLKNIMDVSIAGTEFSYSEMASFLGTDADSLRFLFVYNDSASAGWTLSVYDAVGFILSNRSVFSSMMSAQEFSELETLETIMKSVLNNTYYSSSELADIFGMDPEDLESLFLLYVSRHGDLAGWGMSVQDLVDFIISDVLTNEDYAGMIDSDYADELSGLKTLIDAVVSGKKYDPEGCRKILSSFSGAPDENTTELLYLYKASLERGDESRLMSVEELFYYLHDDILSDARFEEFIDDEAKDLIRDYKTTLEDAAAQLVGPWHSRLIITSKYPLEGDDTMAFIDKLSGELENFDGDTYLIGESAMSWEMSQTFSSQMWLITLIAAAAIFIIVLLTFRNFIIPIILVLLVQCGVYITIAVTGLLGYSEYYLAYVIVECILMGATVDYAILFTNFYRTGRKTMPIREAIHSAYKGSIHTIMTSGLVITVVTGIMGIFASDPTTAEVCRTIAIGALSVILLIIFILPGMLAAFDRLVVRKSDREGAPVPAALGEAGDGKAYENPEATAAGGAAGAGETYEKAMLDEVDTEYDPYRLSDEPPADEL